MLEMFSVYFLSGIATIAVTIYLQKRILDKKLDFKSPRLYLGFILALIFGTFNCMYVSGFIRILMSTIMMTLMCCIIFKVDILSAFSAAVLQEFVVIISELIFSLTLVLFQNDLLKAFSNQTILLAAMNIIISIFAILIYNIPFVSKFLDRIIKYLTKIEGFKKYFLMLFLIITMNVLLMSMYFNSKNVYVIIINTIFIIIYSGIVYLLFNEKIENARFKNENKLLIENLNEYEKMLDYQRIANHENRNQLAVIKGMIHRNNRRALDYIDEIINESRPINESLFTQAKRIPSGGLQGLVYQKLLLMQEKKIVAKIDISRNIRKFKIASISAKINFDLCRIVGIILDNAIEEVEKLEDKEIYLSMYDDNGDFVIEISNRFRETIDLEKLNDKGYTTKSSGHGYGLYLLKEIVSKNDSIENERMITSDIFTQIVKIKM